MQRLDEIARLQKLAGIKPQLSVLNEANEENKKISYTAIVLDKASHDALIKLVPSGWDSSKTCHHCTLNMGPAKENTKPNLGQDAQLKVLGFASDDKVCAVKVEIVSPQGLSTEGIAHVTVAVTNGGKPFLAGKLDFSKMSTPEGMPTDLKGVVKEVPEGDYSLAD